MKSIPMATFLAAVVVAPSALSAAPVRTCESLTSLTLPRVTITLAQTVGAGTFKPTARSGGGPRTTVQTFASLLAFCRVTATLTPTPDSDIKVELWLPISNWNNKYQAVGNGGWGGGFNWGELSQGVARGYATSSTDTGHASEGASFALGHPEKLIDYAYRAQHEMAVTSKAVIDAFYGSGPKLSYFNGCSTGGRQGLVAAQRFPEDFDGIIAGAAANPKPHLDAWRLWLSQAMLKDVSSFIPPAKHPALHRAVVAQCDALDGVKDGLLEDPTQCHFDPKVLQCQGADAPTCLTAPQVEAARVVMSPVKNRQTGALIFPGFEPGTELGWGRALGGTEPYDNALDNFRYIVFNDPQWNWRTFDLERDTAAADKAAGGVLAAVDPNLSAFARRGGKLLTYHGWADPSIAPQASINFYKSTLAVTTPPAASPDWVRLFMVPGMAHCRGGEGPDTFDAVGALEQWVEQGKAPGQMLASHSTGGKIDRTRPLCAYPQVASYTGAGSVDDAANFICKAPR